MSNNCSCTCAGQDTPLVASARTLSKWSGWGQSDAWLCAAIVIFSIALWCTCIRVSCHYAARKAWSDRARLCEEAVKDGEQEDHHAQEGNSEAAFSVDSEEDIPTDPPLDPPSQAGGEGARDDKERVREQESSESSGGAATSTGELVTVPLAKAEAEDDVV